LLEAYGDLVENVEALLDFKAKGRNVTEGGAGYQLREESAHSEALFSSRVLGSGRAKCLIWNEVLLNLLSRIGL
jgi:hypothetical protein